MGDLFVVVIPKLQLVEESHEDFVKNVDSTWVDLRTYLILGIFKLLLSTTNIIDSTLSIKNLD